MIKIAVAGCTFGIGTDSSAVWVVLYFVTTLTPREALKDNDGSQPRRPRAALDHARGRPVHEIVEIANEETGKPAEIPVRKVLETGVVQGLPNPTVVFSSDGPRTPIGDGAARIRDFDGSLLGVVLVYGVSRSATIERTRCTAARISCASPT